LDDGDKRLLRGLTGFEEAGKVAALPQLRHTQVQRAQTGVEGAIPIPVAPGRAVAVAFMASGTDQAVNIGLHDQLKDSLSDAAQQVALIVLLQKLC